MTFSWLVDLWMFMIASTFFAGVFGFAIMRSHEPLHGLRWMLALKALDGLIVGMAAVALIQANGDVNALSTAWIWASLITKGVVSISVWVFVLDMAGKIRKPK